MVHDTLKRREEKDTYQPFECKIAIKNRHEEILFDKIL